MANTTPSFTVIGAAQIAPWLDANPDALVKAVKQAYLQHAHDNTINPDSYFLRFPDHPRQRIIALPASIESDNPITGIKWISSFPENIDKGLDRASTVLIVNDRHTGYPRACLEGSLISAARTAASAILGASYLHPTPKKIKQLGVVGCGPIAYRTLELLVKLGWEIDTLCMCDLSETRSQMFRDKSVGWTGTSYSAPLESTIRESDMVLIATSATQPYITSPAWFSHAPTVLHMSLRDLAPEIILVGQNIADDVSHCLKAQTSPHLASLQVGHHDFMAGGIADLIERRVAPDNSRPRIFSPFGMGILDLAVAQQLLETLNTEDKVCIYDFFPDAYSGS
ncbi:ornithine cyclodeaminase [Xenorhabdus beddingii]|uniref:Ornithine cyclodeaminase n=1 Tax=Xenorhabdus beddingii TaxID=40578 RepID=A0A1Y2SRV3_9GAMM|nr:2,3-diaminopropionate biosynthesis protein SbnB [Xenorhabdus beddingii]OTA21878.1 ornithine cyclodeaminase [Xenorhabdus beddingii]